MVVLTKHSNPLIRRDFQGSLALKVAVVSRGVVIHGATLRHAAAPVYAVFIGVFWTAEDAFVHDGTARVFEEGFL